MNRITVEMVEQAKERNQIPLVRGVYAKTKLDKLEGACALCQVFMAKKKLKPEKVTFTGIFTRIKEELKLKDSYAKGFMTGFDDGKRPTSIYRLSEEWEIGFLDGVAVGEHFKEEILGAY